MTDANASNATLGGGDVQIRVQQRNGRKSITTVQGLNPKLNFERVNREFMKRWGCNGTVIDDKQAGKVIQLQGNWSENVKQFLLEERLTNEGNLKISGMV
jgi:translation initiation factor 1